MPVKLLFITSHYFYQPTLDALARLQIPCETKVIPYDNYRHISELYGLYAEQYDACFTSGIVAKQAIELVHPHPRKPLVPFQISANALHRDILKVIVDAQSMDLTRIAMDFMLSIGDDYSVADFLKIEDIDSVYRENSLLTRKIGIKNGYTVENLVLEKIVALWDSGAIDLVICQYSSIVPMLQERGIPFRCSFVSDHRLNALIQEVLVKIELNHLHNNHPAMIQVFPRYTTAESPDQIDTLHKLLQEYIRSNLIDCVLQENGSCCVLISSLSILRFLTNEFRECRLSAWLEQRISFPVSVAYGIGTTVSHAMNNVQIASKEAKLLGKSFIVDSNGNLIGPLNSEDRMVITSHSLPDASEIARRCNLSAMTIQKLMSIAQNSGSNKITTQDLAQKMDTTVRNANRIMLNLCRGQAAKPVYTQSSHSRGRPIQVYELNFTSVSY